MRLNLEWHRQLSTPWGCALKRAWAASLGFLILAALTSPAQDPATTIAPGVPSPQASRLPDANDLMLMREARAKQMNFEAVNAERLKEIIQASEIVQTLAISLEAEIDKDSSGGVSASELKKVDNIEKLAHAVKERMKLTIAPY